MASPYSRREAHQAQPQGRFHTLDQSWESKARGPETRPAVAAAATGPSPLPAATLERLAYAFPAVHDYLRALEADRDRQQRRCEAKASEVLRSINVGQELMGQLDAVRAHCVGVVRERDALQLRVGHLQREREARRESSAGPPPAGQKRSKKPTEVEVATKADGVLAAADLHRQLEALRAAKEAHGEARLRLEKDLFERTLQLDSTREKLAEAQQRLEAAQGEQRRAAEAADRDAARSGVEELRSQFLSVSDARAVTMLMAQLRDQLRSHVKRRSAGSERKPAGLIQERRSGRPTAGSASVLASSRFTTRAFGGDASTAMDGFVETPRTAKRNARVRARAAGEVSSVLSTSATHDQSHHSSSSHSDTIRGGDSNRSSDSGDGEEVDRRLWSGAVAPSDSLPLATVSRHDALQWMIALLNGAMKSARRLRAAVDGLDAGVARREEEIGRLRLALVAAEEGTAAALKAAADKDRQLASGKAEQERLRGVAAAEKAHLERAAADAEGRAGQRVETAERDLAKARQLAAAGRAALVAEASLEFDRLQAAHGRLEAELAQHRGGAAAREERHAAEVAGLRAAAADLEAELAELRAERAAALAEIGRHHESLEQLRAAAEGRLRARDEAAAAHLRGCLAEGEERAEAAQREAASLREQLAALHRAGQEELDAAQAAKLTAQAEAQRLADALAVLKAESIPEMRRREAELVRALAAAGEDAAQARAVLAALGQREQEEREARAGLEGRLVAAVERVADLERLVEGEGRAAAQEREAAAALLAEKDRLRAALEAVGAQAQALQRQVAEHGEGEGRRAEAAEVQLVEGRRLLAASEAVRATAGRRAAVAEERALLLDEELRAARKTVATAESRAVAAAAEAKGTEEGLSRRVALQEQAAARCQSALAAAEARAEAGQREAAALSAACADADGRAVGLAEELDMVRLGAAEEHHQQLRRLRQACDAVAGEHEAALANKEQELAAARAALQRVEAAFREKEAALAETAERGQRAAVSGDAKLRERTAADAAEVQRLRQDRASLAEGKAAAEAHARGLAAGAEAAAADLRAARQGLEQCAAERRQLSEANAALATELAEVRADAADGARRLRASAAHDAAVLSARLDALTAAREADGQRHRQETQRLRVAMEAAVEAARREAGKEADRRAAQASGRLAELEAAAARLQSALQSAEEDRARLQAALKALRGEVTAMQRALEEKERGLEVSTAQREEELRHRHTTELAAKATEAADLGERCDALEAELRRQTARAQGTAGELGLAGRSQAAQGRELEALRNINRHLEARLAEIESDRDPLRQQLHSLLTTDGD